MISGCIGPQDDGYQPDQLLSARRGREYHSTQIGTFADTAADLVTAITMTYADEAIGIARAAAAAGMPGGDLVHGRDRRSAAERPGAGEAIEQVDAETGDGPAYYMVNCAHPTHFEGVLDAGAGWAGRIRGLRANASTMSHAELDEATELDEGDPADLGARYAALQIPASEPERARRLLRHGRPPCRAQIASAWRSAESA